MVKEMAKTSRRSRLRRKRKKEEVGGKRGQGEMEPTDSISGNKASCFLRGSNVENQHNEPQFKHVLIVLEYLLP